MHIGVSEAVRRIQQGEVVAIPTDTVYGLACDFRNPEALAELFALKQRSSDNPLVILAASVHEVERFLVSEPESFYELADAYWPGALTLVMPIDQGLVPGGVRAGLPTAGFRVPAAPEALELLRATGPLAVTSANLSGQSPATNAAEVEATFRDLGVIDGGQCADGLPSTILSYEGGKWRCLRVGSLGELVGEGGERAGDDEEGDGDCRR